MAHYNTKTKEIEGCKKNSPIYWHEMGHKVMDEINLDVQIKFFKDILIFISVFCISLNKNLLGIYCIVLAFILYFGEEISAWIYALIKFKEWNK